MTASRVPSAGGPCVCLRADLADSGCTEVVAAPAEMVVRVVVPLCRLTGQKTVSVAQKTARNGRGFERRYRPEPREFTGFSRAAPGPSRTQKSAALGAITAFKAAAILGRFFAPR